MTAVYIDGVKQEYVRTTPPRVATAREVAVCREAGVCLGPVRRCKPR